MLRLTMLVVPHSSRLLRFMSQSMGWADNIIFAMAPLGVITAIIGAIRVGGPVWLKAIVGRARENQATAEVELMSSTSTDVCELWNGQTIVRMMGSPQILELFYFPTLRYGSTCGLFTLQQAIDDGLFTENPGWCYPPHASWISLKIRRTWIDQTPHE